jgi:hypothetical protein
LETKFASLIDGDCLFSWAEGREERDMRKRGGKQREGNAEGER